MRALIVDGQNGHDIWPKTTAMLKSYLEQTGLFEVDVARTAFVWQGDPYEGDGGETTRRRAALLADYAVAGRYTLVAAPEPDPNFRPDFGRYDIVVSNFGWRAAAWPDDTRTAFEAYVAGGGGFVVVHAANNCFPDWPAYNQMTGIGGWADRDERCGPYVYVENGGVKFDPSPGPAGSHGYEMEFPVDLVGTHPITAGLPRRWLHARDELYERLRGPAQGLTVLATAYSDVEKNASYWTPIRGSGRNEPLVLIRDQDQGRVFHLVLGHFDYSMECVGFITLFQRGAEWAASGQVTLPLPLDFPGEDEVRVRPMSPAGGRS